MAKKHDKPLNRTQCDVCGYYNSINLVKGSGVCHLCGKILDGRAYFKAEMNRRLRLWRGKRQDGNTWWNDEGRK